MLRDIVESWFNDKADRTIAIHYNIKPRFLHSLGSEGSMLAVFIPKLRFGIAWRVNLALDNRKVSVCMRNRIRLLLVPPVNSDVIKTRLDYQESLMLMYSKR